MPRNLDPAVNAAYHSGLVAPFIAVMITFASQTFYLWTGPRGWDIVFDGQTWRGTGDLGEVAVGAETGAIEATGASVTLSGVDIAILQESIDDVRLGAPAIIYEGALDPYTGAMLGNPSVLFAGMVDQPTVGPIGPDNKCSITINLETQFIRLGSGSQRKFTSADQRLRNPTDTIFANVERLADQALRWGS